MSVPYTSAEIEADREILRTLVKILDELEAETRDAIHVSAVEGGRFGNPVEFGQRLAMILFRRERARHLERLLNGFMGISQDRTVFGQRLKAVEMKLNEITKRVMRIVPSIKEAPADSVEAPE